MNTPLQWLVVIALLIMVFSISHCIANFRSIIDSVKRPKEVVRVISYVKSFFERNQSAPTEIKEESIKRVLRDKKELRQALLESPPNEVALILIKNVAFDYIAYGNCYVYRGLLSMEGERYLACYKQAMEELVSCGSISQQQYDNELMVLNDRIKENG